jgi:hypothetical protein
MCGKMTPMTANPAGDQDRARLADLERLKELVHPHLPHPGAPIQQALPHMTLDDRAEALAIVARLGDIGEPPESTRARQQILLDLASAEDALREILDRGQPRHRAGKVLLDLQTGRPLRNRNVDRSARAQLRQLERLRSKLTGLPPDGQDS